MELIINDFPIPAPRPEMKVAPVTWRDTAKVVLLVAVMLVGSFSIPFFCLGCSYVGAWGPINA